MKRNWWKEAVVYQIYPRSFYDSNGDGIGDLNGIIEKLDYIKSLGTDTIWLCPVYKSPNDDNGYDISDYCDIMDDFGNMADFDELLEEVHKRGMRLIMDIAFNHTSDQHPWFTESRSSKDNPKRDYYIWRQGKEGREPNNWRSFFSSSAWEYDKKTEEYYLHLFSKKQPDLNWNNNQVREEIYNIIRYWLDKGVDGFRMDAVNLVLKPQTLPDSQKPPATPGGYVFDEDMYANQLGIHELLRDMNEKVLSRYDIVTIGETLNVTTDDAKLYSDEDRYELDLICHFELMSIDSGPKWKWDVVRWRLTDLKKIMAKWQTELFESGWNSIYFSNHDQPRMVSRFGNDNVFRVESAKLLATLLLTLQGTPFIYQGEEIGMTNVRFQSIDDYRDVETLNFYSEALNSGWEYDDVMQAIYAKGRDNVRTPMQWDSSDKAGFTGGQPWIRENPNYKEINVEQSSSDPDSVFNYYRELIRIRKNMPVFIYGSFKLLLENDPYIFSYIREDEDTTVLVILNFSDKDNLFKLPDEIAEPFKELIISNYKTENSSNQASNINLRPYEARIYATKKSL